MGKKPPCPTCGAELRLLYAYGIPFFECPRCEWRFSAVLMPGERYGKRSPSHGGEDAET